MAREYQMHSRMLSAAEAKAMTPGNEPDWIGGVHSPTDGRAEPPWPAPPSPKRRAGWAPRSTRIAPRAGWRRAAGKVSGVITEKGAHPHRRPCCAPAARGAACSAAGTGCGCRRPACSSTVVRDHGRARSHRQAACRCPTSRSAAGSMAATRSGLGGRGLLEVSPQGLLLRAPVLADLQEAALGPDVRHRPLVLRRAGGTGALVVRPASPFERHRTLDPGADPKLVPARPDAAEVEHYPALAGLGVADCGAA